MCSSMAVLMFSGNEVALLHIRVDGEVICHFLSRAEAFLIHPGYG